MTIEETVKFVEAISRVGLSAEQVGNALRKMGQALFDVNRLDNNSKTQMGRIIQLEQENAILKSRIAKIETSTQCQIGYGNAEIEETKNALKDLQYITTDIKGELQERIAAIEQEVSNIRSDMDAKTENPNQKSDLEISSQIEVNPFLPGFVDLDSEDFIQQRPSWDFTVDF